MKVPLPTLARIRTVLAKTAAAERAMSIEMHDKSAFDRWQKANLALVEFDTYFLNDKMVEIEVEAV